LEAIETLQFRNTKLELFSPLRFTCFKAYMLPMPRERLSCANVKMPKSIYSEVTPIGSGKQIILHSFIRAGQCYAETVSMVPPLWYNSKWYDKLKIHQMRTNYKPIQVGGCECFVSMAATIPGLVLNSFSKRIQRHFMRCVFMQMDDSKNSTNTPTYDGRDPPIHRKRDRYFEKIYYYWLPGRSPHQSHKTQIRLPRHPSFSRSATITMVVRSLTRGFAGSLAPRVEFPIYCLGTYGRIKILENVTTKQPAKTGKVRPFWNAGNSELNTLSENDGTTQDERFAVKNKLITIKAKLIIPLYLNSRTLVVDPTSSATSTTSSSPSFTASSELFSSLVYISVNHFIYGYGAIVKIEDS